MKFKDIEVVRTLVDFPKEKIFTGEIGTIVACFNNPNEAYLVEFLMKDGSGKTRAMFPILPEHLEPANL